MIWVVRAKWARTRGSAVAPHEQGIMGIVFNRWRPGKRPEGAINPSVIGAVDGDDLRWCRTRRRKNGTDSTPSKVGSAITPTEDSSSSDCEVQPYSDCHEGPSSAPLTPATHLRNSTPVGPERVSMIVGMACIWVKGERVIPKDPKPALGGEIIIGSLDVRGRGMSCGSDARRDRGDAAGTVGGGAVRAGDCPEELFDCIARRGGVAARVVRRVVCRRGCCAATVSGVAVRLRWWGGAGAVRRRLAVWWLRWRGGAGAVRRQLAMWRCGCDGGPGLVVWRDRRCCGVRRQRQWGIVGEGVGMYGRFRVQGVVY
nr:hypothetical protein Iba_chr09aCG13760 [Ipomoea batatas]